MAFDPNVIPDDQCSTGHLDADPVYEVITAIGRTKVTGRLTVEDAAGENHMFFMQGQPVGVQLAEYIHPLGQLLLELGRVDGRAFVRAQRRISEGQRLAGQVFKELGCLDDAQLKEVLSLQARRKAEYFCRYGSRAFTFCRGLGFLSGFSATPLNVHAVIYLAVQQQMGPQSREAWLESMKHNDVKLRAGSDAPLPAPLADYNFGPPEERFLLRLASDFHGVDHLAETGTLPRDEMAVLLRYVELIGRLETRTRTVASSTEDDVFSTSRPATAAPTGAPVSDVFERTDPGRQRDIHNVPTEVGAEPAPAPRPRAQSSAPPMKSLLFPSEETLEPEPAPAPPRRKKKKKKRRHVPEPSVGSSAISETKKEKTGVHELPSIVIDEGD